MSLAASFVATRVYYASLKEGEGAAMDESVAWMIVGGLSGLGIFSFICFLLLMKPAYRSTFISTQTGHDWVKEKFIHGDTDESKAWTLGCNKQQWLSIRPDVKAWTMGNWERWEDEKPAWYNDAFRASVADDMIPPASLRRMNMGGESRRRSSLGEQLGMGRKASAPTVVPVISNE
jgi:hypothetical protein